MKECLDEESGEANLKMKTTLEDIKNRFVSSYVLKNGTEGYYLSHKNKFQQR